MSSIFQLASNDQSIYYLFWIFGSVGNTLNNATGGGGATVINIVGTLLRYLNTLALTFGAFMVVYTVVVGLLKTAAEGEFLGKHWNSLWVPIRTVMGIAALFPTTSGYSALQVIMMWCIVQGVAAGDTMWTTAVNYANKQGSPYATISVPSVQTQNSIENLFYGLVCQATAANNNSQTYTSGSNTHSLYYCGDSNNSSDPFCAGRAVYPLLNIQNGSTPVGPANGSQGMCGTLKVNCPSSTDANFNAICTTQLAALTTINQVLNQIAVQFVQGDNSYLTFWQSGQLAASGTPQYNYCQILGVSTPAQCCSQTNPLLGALQFLTGGGSVPPCPAGGATGKVATQSFNKMPPWTYDSQGNPTNNFFASPSDYAVNYMYVPYLQTLIPAILNSNQMSTTGTANNFISILTNGYSQVMTPAINAYLTALTNSLGNQANTTGGWQSDAVSQGWMFAGAYYYKMANNNSTTQSTLPSWNFIPNDPSNASGSGNSMTNYRNNYQAAKTLISTITNQPAAGAAPDTTANTFASLSSNPSLSQVGSLTGQAGAGILDAFRNMLTNYGATQEVGTNFFAVSPLISLHAFGESLLILADVLLTLVLTITIALLMLGWAPFFMGNGAVTPLTTLGLGMMMIVLPPAFTIIGSLYAFGGLIAVYTPLIPYIIFIMGAVGWMMAVIEAMVAMPFVALGMMSPSGEHEILGRSHHALSHIFNLILRPSLMVFGLIVSMFLAGAGVTLVNMTFAGVMSSIGGAGSSGNVGLPELIMFIAAYVTLILTVLNKCFTIIYIIPQQVLTWIGFQAVAYGEGDALQGIKQAVEGAGSQFAQAAGSAAMTATKGKHAVVEKGEKEGAQAALQTAISGNQPAPDAAPPPKKKG